MLSVNPMSCWRGLSLAAMVFLCGCTILPSYGPAGMDIGQQHSGSDAMVNGYLVVNLDATTLSRINAFVPLAFPRAFTGGLGGFQSQVIGVGDRLIVNIWEPSQDGVFATAGNRQASLQVVVEGDGKIYIPYAGHVQASGRSIESLRSAIEEKLQGTAVEPQVQVVLEKNDANAVVVVGDVSRTGRFPISVSGMRLMDAIAQAGGARGATYETIATVTRGKHSGTIRLDEVARFPANNIRLSPGDNVLVLHQPRTYSAFGAVQNGGLFPFKSETLSLAESLAQVGGLNDKQADTGAIFLFRFENRKLAEWLSQTGQGSGQIEGAAADVVPVIYRLDFRNPQAFFLAQIFRMRDKDIIYVASHPTAELGKFLATIVSPIVGAASVVKTIGR